MFERASGVLTHVTSLPSPHGVGAMGKAAYEFIDFLAAAHQTYWQVLPLGHTGFGNSPYQCFSAAAGNPFLIDLDLLAQNGLLTAQEIEQADFAAPAAQVDFEQLASSRPALWRKAFSRADAGLLRKVHAFCKENEDWLPDYALFMALKEERYGNRPLYEWDDEALRARAPQALKDARNSLQDEIEYRMFLQYLFFEQWSALRAYANGHGIRIIGDLPIYVSADSVEVWTHPHLFKLKADLSPRMGAGVPPDYYSETGQLWGNPVYEWKNHSADGYAWWIWRMKSNLQLYDIVRIDHFRGFEAYYEVEAGLPDAVHGAWRKGPNMELFRALKNALGDMPVVAEDLGVITDGVRELLRKSGFPGMRVLIFGFTPDEDSEHLPHSYPHNSIVYTSTHDAQTVFQQVTELCSPAERAFAMRYLRAQSEKEIGWCAVQSVFSSHAHTAIAALQDILCLGGASRMNLPATIGGDNWRWRMEAGALTPAHTARLAEITDTYKRAPAPRREKDVT